MEISEANFSNVCSIISYAVTIVLMTLFIAVAVVVCIYIFKSDPTEQIPGPFECLFVGFNMNKKAGYFYTTLFLMRRSILAVSVTLISQKYVQLCVYFWTNLAHLMFICVWKPFEESIDNLIYAITDLSICILTVLYFCFISSGVNLEISSSGLQIITDVICYTILATNLLISLIYLLVSIKTIVRKISAWKKDRKYKLKKIEVNPKEIKKISNTSEVKSSVNLVQKKSDNTTSLNEGQSSIINKKESINFSGHPPKHLINLKYEESKTPPKRQLSPY
ncbi:unnamed protein product [Moneuplotes crassus]|uniref:Uncharacterized protein n=1 Tax=Euplotes crassus TaxID=5936 RepID=A0AAD1XQJ6_EUPCR|nr:unnamed protein product [Moneuplotes crassus]